MRGYIMGNSQIQRKDSNPFSSKMTPDWLFSKFRPLKSLSFFLILILKLLRDALLNLSRLALPTLLEFGETDLSTVVVIHVPEYPAYVSDAPWTPQQGSQSDPLYWVCTLRQHMPHLCPQLTLAQDVSSSRYHHLILSLRSSNIQ